MQQQQTVIISSSKADTNFIKYLGRIFP